MDQRRDALERVEEEGRLQLAAQRHKPLFCSFGAQSLPLDRGHARTRALSRSRQSLRISPATLLELQFLEEAGRIRLFGGDTGAIAIDDRWTLDDPPAASWFAAAMELSWTRDPFDRLIVAHALASRATLAGGILPNNRANLLGWVANPQALKPGSKMPSVPLAPDTLHAIVHYLMGLE